MSAASALRRFAAPIASAAIVALLGLMEAGFIPARLALPASNILQLALALFATLACLWAARRPAARASGRAWRSRAWPGRRASSSGWCAACRSAPIRLRRGRRRVLGLDRALRGRLRAAARPARLPAAAARDRRAGRGGRARLPYFEIAYVHLLLGDLPAYEAWSTSLFDLRGLALLARGAVGAALRRSAPEAALPAARQRLPAAPARRQRHQPVVLVRIGGPYHAGFYDLPWTLPFAWIGLLALRSAPIDAEPVVPRPERWQRQRARDDRRVRRRAAVPGGAGAAGPGGRPAVAAHPAARRRGARGHLGRRGALPAAPARGAAGRPRPRCARARSASAPCWRTPRRGSGSTVPTQRPVRERRHRAHARAPRRKSASGATRSTSSTPTTARRRTRSSRTVLRAPGERVSGSLRFVAGAGEARELELEAVEPARRAGRAGHRRQLPRRDREAPRRGRARALGARCSRRRSSRPRTASWSPTSPGGRSASTRSSARCGAMPRELLASSEGERAIASVLDQLVEPQAFLDRVRELYGRAEAESLDTLHFHDGRVFERYSLPQRLGGEVVGRVWSFRDVSERTHARQATERLVAIIEATPDLVGHRRRHGATALPQPRRAPHAGPRRRRAARRAHRPLLPRARGGARGARGAARRDPRRGPGAARPRSATARATRYRCCR